MVAPLQRQPKSPILNSADFYFAPLLNRLPELFSQYPTNQSSEAPSCAVSSAQVLSCGIEVLRRKRLSSLGRCAHEVTSAMKSGFNWRIRQTPPPERTDIAFAMPTDG
jgi:hypothetical protein